MTDTTDPVVDTTVLDANETETEQLDADSSPAVTDADDSAQPKKTGAERRIDELTRLRRDAERDRDHWRQQAQRQTPAPQEAAKPEATVAAPRLEDFEYDESKYQAAVLKHATTEAARLVREELRQEREREQGETRQRTFKSREDELAKKHTDYHEVTRDDTLPVSKVMAEIIRESDIGPELLYHLANNRDEAERIYALPAMAAALALGRITAKLEVPASAPVQKPVSKAPPPPPKIEGTDATVRVDSTDPNSDKLSDAAWFKAEEARVKRQQSIRR